MSEAFKKLSEWMINTGTYNKPDALIKKLLN